MERLVTVSVLLLETQISHLTTHCCREPKTGQKLFQILREAFWKTKKDFSKPGLAFLQAISLLAADCWLNNRVHSSNKESIKFKFADRAQLPEPMLITEAFITLVCKMEVWVERKEPFTDSEYPRIHPSYHCTLCPDLTGPASLFQTTP